MADLQSEILNKFDIDLAQENIFKLYKIDNVDISSDDLEMKIQDTRKRWNISINGANEKNAERDKTRLEKADKYETILRDKRLRKKVFDYYKKSVKGGSEGEGDTAVKFAKEYFKLVATTKKIRKEDVDFFFKYYKSERKNKKAIIEMLKKDLKVIGLGNDANSADDSDSNDEKKKKDTSSFFVVTLFKEATVLKIRGAIEKYEEALKSDELCQRFPLLRKSLYEYLDIDQIEDVTQFTQLMTDRGKEVFAIRQEYGTDYVPLVDLFNIMQTVGEYKDVEDNIQEFKLLLRYPELTPYMYSFLEMKPATIKGMVQVANQNYKFKNDSDFILNYFILIYKNFGIRVSGIASLIKKAEKSTERNKILNKIDKALGIDKRIRKAPGIRWLIHWLVYWPIFAVYFVFEVSKAIFTELHRFTIPMFILSFLILNWMLPKFGFESMLELKKLFSITGWKYYVMLDMGIYPANGLELFILSLIEILKLSAIPIIISGFIAYFISEFSEDINKRFDWDGLERTFQKIFDYLRSKTEDQYLTNRKQFFRINLIKVFVNIASLLLIVIAIKAISFRPYSNSISTVNKPIETTYHADQVETTKEETSSSDIIMVINANSANIRSGPGTSYSILLTSKSGDVFIATGNKETLSSGRIWYEIYLDEEKSKTGWASEKVIDFQ